MSMQLKCSLNCFSAPYLSVSTAQLLKSVKIHTIKARKIRYEFIKHLCPVVYSSKKLFSKSKTNVSCDTEIPLMIRHFDHLYCLLTTIAGVMSTHRFLSWNVSFSSISWFCGFTPAPSVPWWQRNKLFDDLENGIKWVVHGYAHPESLPQRAPLLHSSPFFRFLSQLRSFSLPWMQGSCWDELKWNLNLRVKRLLSISVDFKN